MMQTVVQLAAMKDPLLYFSQYYGWMVTVRGWHAPGIL